MTSIVLGADVGLPGVVLPDARLRDAHFDNATDSWTIAAPDGSTVTARTLIDARPSGDAVLAVHGMPNLFRVPGPHTAAQVRFVQQCLNLLEQSGSTRIEAKSRVVLRWWRRATPRGRFHLTGSAPGSDDLYRGSVSVALADSVVDADARLAGHLDAIDGRYHWRGTISGEIPDDVLKGQRTLTISTTSHSAQARVVERTPWGGYTVAGVGAPPFALD
ncbi:DUF4873 domain-containing protein [Mycobacterium sp. ACS4331]|uniref:DUF4873 domain-containing protein n=1 Tax=Mycobacterium sp. ACS4331 TaxID=1834121 RepID=UPI0007FE942D|nr:DUF4873 domain-containing protein [Mycobacterium sp. ACS4331]OBF29703.1 hypothetical protein A5727_23875 [Mycobacterium sp. ACS4331]